MVRKEHLALKAAGARWPCDLGQELKPAFSLEKNNAHDVSRRVAFT